jgi:hypothetical protein
LQTQVLLPVGRWPCLLEKIQNHTRLPQHMDPQNLWRTNPDGLSEFDSLHSSPELWLSSVTGGAQAHMDHHVSTTTSMQLSGRKRWRLGQMPPRRSVTRRSEYADGAVYRRKKVWKPHYDFILDDGDALFFPPGQFTQPATWDLDAPPRSPISFLCPCQRDTTRASRHGFDVTGTCRRVGN